MSDNTPADAGIVWGGGGGGRVRCVSWKLRPEVGQVSEVDLRTTVAPRTQHGLREGSPPSSTPTPFFMLVFCGWGGGDKLMNLSLALSQGLARTEPWLATAWE